MTTDHAAITKRHLEEYEKESQNWRADHDEAMACLDLEQLIQLGISAYKAICSLDEAWRDKVYSGRIAYDPGMDQLITEMLTLWAKRSKRVAQLLKKFERKGYDVAGRVEFSSAVREVAGMLTPPAEFFGEGLVSLRDAAVEANRRGELQEFTVLGE